MDVLQENNLTDILVFNVQEEKNGFQAWVAGAILAILISVPVAN